MNARYVHVSITASLKNTLQLAVPSLAKQRASRNICGQVRWFLFLFLVAYGVSTVKTFPKQEVQDERVELDDPQCGLHSMKKKS
jgi:hypothetical protein